jgi:ribosomal protein L37AE/L43A
MAQRREVMMIRINEDMKKKFSSYCDQYGMTMSAMSAIIVGTWVCQQDKSLTQTLKPSCPKCNGEESLHSVEIDVNGNWKCHECGSTWIPE